MKAHYTLQFRVTYLYVVLLDGDGSEMKALHLVAKLNRTFHSRG